MGEVHLARDIHLRRKVAFKKTTADASKSRELTARFFGEAQITSQLDHPNIVPIYGLEVAPDGSLAYAMKLVQGRELSNLIKETRELYEKAQPLDEKHTLEYRVECFLKICDAMAFAHSRGIIHRDLKPANIMIGRYNEVYVMDWGIARVVGDRGAVGDQAVELQDRDGSALDTGRTQIGAALGTPCYMSPEQARGENNKLDARSDLYTLGLILTELVTLKRAITGGSFEQVFTSAMAGEKQPIEHFHASGHVPSELKAVIEKATRVRREDRYEDVSAFAEDIRRFLHGDEVLARPDNQFQKATRWISKHRSASFGIMSSILMLILGAAATIGTLLYKQGELEAAHRREKGLSAFLTAASIQSHEIDNEFLRYESELENIASAAQMVLSHAPPSRIPVHVAGEGFTPDDLAESPYYGRRISFDYPVFSLSPGVRAAPAMVVIRKLSWLQPVFRRGMLQSYHDDAHLLPIEEQRRILVDDGVPMQQVFVTLADGVHVSYPGMEVSCPEDYDARQSPYYTLVENTSGAHWGQPTSDSDGSGLVLPCSIAIHDEDNRFRGVAGFEVSLRFIIDELLDIREFDFEEAMLVDRDGMIMVHKLQRDAKARVPELHPGRPAELTPLPFPEILEATKKGLKGFSELPEQKLIVTYYPVDAIGWYYVVAAKVDAILAERPGMTS